jgi:D-glycero-D-manno-heptose 1,7-bisphosphate phosphatase
VQALRKAAFLDRDGVINVDRAYVSRWEDFEFVPSAVDAMRALKQAGFALVVVTNQSGIARGYYTEDQYQALTIAMKKALAEAGAAIDAVYHCPHHPAGTVAGLTVECECRKPAPGMIFRAARELNLSFPNSILVGDKPSDIQAARAAGVGKSYIVHSDNAESGSGLAGADATYFDLYSCVADLCGTPLNLQNK